MRHNGYDGGAVDFLHGFQNHFGNGHQRSGVAGGNDRLGAAGADGVNCHIHAGVAVADNLGRLVFVFYPFCRMTDFAHFRQSGILLEQRRDFGFVPEQQKTDVGVFPGGDVHPLNDDSRGIISPHRINRYNQIIRQNCAPSSSMTVLVYSAAFLATTSRLSY